PFHRLAQLPDRQRCGRRRGDRDARGQDPGSAAAGGRGPGRLGAPAPPAAVVAAASPPRRRPGQPAGRRPGRVGLTDRAAQAVRSSKDTTVPVPGEVVSSSRTSIRTTSSPASTVSSTGASVWRRALATSSLAMRPASSTRLTGPARVTASAANAPALPGACGPASSQARRRRSALRPSTRWTGTPPATVGGQVGHSSSWPGSTGCWTWRRGREARATPRPGVPGPSVALRAAFRVPVSGTTGKSLSAKGITPIGEADGGGDGKCLPGTIRPDPGLGEDLLQVSVCLLQKIRAGGCICPRGWTPTGSTSSPPGACPRPGGGWPKPTPTGPPSGPPAG